MRSAIAAEAFRPPSWCLLGTREPRYPVPFFAAIVVARVAFFDETLTSSFRFFLRFGSVRGDVERMDSDDPIVDIIQGLTQVAAIAVTLKHIGTSWHELFTGHCRNCRGTGRVTCKHVRLCERHGETRVRMEMEAKADRRNVPRLVQCHGSATLRKRPSTLQRIHEGNLRDYRPRDLPGNTYRCIFCGDGGNADEKDPDPEEEESIAFTVQDNLRAAMANKPRPVVWEPLAGTILCPMCKGCPEIDRHTPVWGRIFRRDRNPFFRYTQQQPMLQDMRPSKTYAEAPKNLREYPPPAKYDLDDIFLEGFKKTETFDGGFEMKVSDDAAFGRTGREEEES